MTTNPDSALSLRPRSSVMQIPEARIQRLGAIVLGRLDRVGIHVCITRIVLYGQRLVAYHLPVPYPDLVGLQLEQYLGEHTGLLARLTATPTGCTLIIDLHSNPRRES